MKINLLLLLIFLAGCGDFSELHLLFSHNPVSDSLTIFSKNFISSENQEHSSLTFSPDGKEIFWSRWQLPHDLEKYPQIIKYTKFSDGKWSDIATAPFSGQWRDGGPAFSPDGERIYFYSRRPKDKTSQEMSDNDIWYVERTKQGWNEAKVLGNEINTTFVEAAPCLSNNGNLYFSSNRNQYPGSTGNPDIFISEFIDGKFTKAKALGKLINTPIARESYPYISPDENYLIFSRDSRRIENGKCIDGDRKLMISFKNDQGRFQEPIELGDEFLNARFPSQSPDGEYLFCTKYTEGNDENYYWIKTDFIKRLKERTK